jgi:hypothetical protein
MLAFLADENFNNDILRGVARRDAEVVIVRAQDVGLSGVDDPTILAWAAEQKMPLLTHDVSTMTRYAYQRVARGLPMPGVFEVSRLVPIRQAIDDIILLARCSVADEWAGMVMYLPLR